MAKKLKTLIFSMTFLTCSVFSAHAMLSEGTDPESDATMNISARPIFPAVDPREEEKVHAFFSHYDFPDFLREGVYSQVKGKAFELNQYGVPHLDYMAALLLYNKRRIPAEFGLLFDLFTKTPLENREKIWGDLVAWQAVGSKGPALYEILYDSDGKVYSSPCKVEGFMSLKDKLISLPHQ